MSRVALPDLLAAAGVVQLDDLHRLRILEVGNGRVVERQVAVLPDPEAAHVQGWAASSVA